MLPRLFLTLALAGCATPTTDSAPSASAPTAAPSQVAMAAPATAAPSPMPEASCVPTTSKSRVKFGTRSIPVDLAFTAASRTTGLSGRSCLAKDTGLVIGWDTPTPARIWMPDMSFAIDVVFVRDGKVIALYADRQPCVSKSDCPTFGPDVPVDYVLEVPAGSISKWKMAVGAELELIR